jgi:coenzyme F420-reducing hydrogenase beta subunit
MCVGCGACAVRTGGKISVTLGRYGVHTADLTAASGPELRAASAVCPFSDESPDEDELAAASFGGLPTDDRIGRVLTLHAGRLRNDEELVASSSGGLTSWTLARLMERGVADGVIHVGRAEDGRFGYRISHSTGELLEHRKSVYTSSTLDQVVSSIRADGRRYILVGVPCFIRAARALTRHDPVLKEQLVYFVGLVCGHLKSTFFAESLAWQAGISPSELESVDFRVKRPGRRANDYAYEARSRSGRVRTRPVRRTIDANWGYGAFQPEACNFCDDVFAETADVVFGDAWLPQYLDDWRGTNVVVTRDRLALDILREGRDSGAIVLEDLSAEDMARSQAGSLRHRRDGLRVRLADDAAAGSSVPRKRVRPGYDHVSPQRVALIRQRRVIGTVSARAFATARQRGDLRLYLRPMGEAIKTYRNIERVRSSLPGRVVARLREWRRRWW